ncbi:hypothetical protein [Georgenia thermotolerans]|uniref:DUF5666 domain-containing protein n=1 Tax=Georgenia thermotolerans TaxID=527326 RepID=A0A7J5UPK9_9MICO|nr:hypothetical protein [Georgenia thermotolerans]KAE8764044.1 hypothetical protein GB883_11010 [Georgenia thermotolerans]
MKVPAGVAGALLVLMASCAIPRSVPDREPDVTGVVHLRSDERGAVLTEASDGYFEGMGLLRSDPLILRLPGNRQIEPSEIEAGEGIEVWVGDVCAESDSVQCEIVALRVLGLRN